MTTLQNLAKIAHAFLFVLQHFWIPAMETGYFCLPIFHYQVQTAATYFFPKEDDTIGCNLHALDFSHYKCLILTTIYWKCNFLRCWQQSPQPSSNTRICFLKVILLSKGLDSKCHPSSLLFQQDFLGSLAVNLYAFSPVF